MDRWERPQRPDELYHWVTPKTHRYIAKIGEGKDARYFYSQEELQAFKSGASNAASKAGQVAQRAVSNAHQRASNAINVARKVTAEGARKAFETADNAVNKVTGHQQKNDMRRFELGSKNERRLAREARARGDKEGANRHDDNANLQSNARIATRRDYEANTLAGRAEKAGRQVRREVDKASRSAKNIAKEVGDTAAWTKKRLGEEAVKKAEDVAEAAKNAKSNIRDKAKEVYDYNVTGEGYKRDAKAQRKASRQFDRDSRDPDALDRGQASKMAREYKEAANKSEQNYKTKSVRGNAERASDFISKHLKKKRKK